MVTKAIIQSINRNTNKCAVRMPLFESASSSGPVVVEALINIPPGVYNNLAKDDVVFVAFEENALEKPIVLGKLYRGPNFEKETAGGAGVFNSIHVRNTSIVQAATTHFKFSSDETHDLTGKNAKNYKQLFTPKTMAYYILDTENDLRRLIAELWENFVCFERMINWKLKPENVCIDDGDIGDPEYMTKYILDADLDCRKKNKKCEICGSRNNCPARFSNKRPTNKFPEKASTAYPPYPSYLHR